MIPLELLGDKLLIKCRCGAWNWRRQTYTFQLFGTFQRIAQSSWKHFQGHFFALLSNGPSRGHLYNMFLAQRQVLNKWIVKWDQTWLLTVSKWCLFSIYLDNLMYTICMYKADRATLMTYLNKIAVTLSRWKDKCLWTFSVKKIQLFIHTCLEQSLIQLWLNGVIGSSNQSS